MWFLVLMGSFIITFLVFASIIALAEWCGAQEDLRAGIRKHLFKSKK